MSLKYSSELVHYVKAGYFECLVLRLRSDVKYYMTMLSNMKYDKFMSFEPYTCIKQLTILIFTHHVSFCCNFSEGCRGSNMSTLH